MDFGNGVLMGCQPPVAEIARRFKDVISVLINLASANRLQCVDQIFQRY